VKAGDQEDGFEGQLVWLDVGSRSSWRCEEVSEALNGESGIGRLVMVVSKFALHSWDLYSLFQP
jgi:hypothetical protein